MRFLTIRHAGKHRPALLSEGQAVLLPEAFSDLVAVIEGGDETKAAALHHAQRRDATRIALADHLIETPVTRFQRDILCCGWNYWDHFDESKGRRDGQDVERPKAPTFFTKGPNTVIGPYDDIAFDDRISKKWDYEAELALVIGKPGRSIPAGRAWNHIFGLTLANDISQRDLQRRHGGQWLKGKSIDRTMPLGPMIVTADELDVPNLRIQCLLNGAVMQNALVSQMAFPIAELLAELSFGMTLRPGDILLTGTPSGIGNAREPQVFLKPEDEVIVRVEGIGELCNRVVKADLTGDTSVVV